ncbi:MAG TPA: response regulator transcription factor [Casimicrobium sp.]|nr:response regulator transcription factor [Casimicrobium sp.]
MNALKLTGTMDQVLLVEDDVPTREWLVSLLTATGEPQLAHACGTVSEALEWLRSGKPADVVLTDLGLPDGSGLDVIREACRTPGREVLVLSIFGDENNVLSAIDAGAGGYLLKDGSIESIREHLRCLRSGGSPLSPRIARTLIRRTREAQTPNTSVAHEGVPLGASTAPLSGERNFLSDRERDVLTGIGKGFSYVEVADALKITTNTVRTHVRHIYEKLSVNSRAEALYEYNRRMAEQGRPPIR